MMTGRSCLYRYAFGKLYSIVQHNLSQKISHSSHNLRIDNIRGSFNGSDIMREIEGLDNSPQNFEEIYELHCCFTFDDNLERLVETTNSIVGTRKKFEPTESEYLNILAAPERAKRFIASEHFRKLDTDLKARVDRVANEIAIASRIDNVNIRGRIIEYLIAGESDDLRNELVAALHADALIPAFKTDDGLGTTQRLSINISPRQISRQKSYTSTATQKLTI